MDRQQYAFAYSSMDRQQYAKAACHPPSVYPYSCIHSSMQRQQYAKAACRTIHTPSQCLQLCRVRVWACRRGKVQNLGNLDGGSKTRCSVNMPCPPRPAPNGNGPAMSTDADPQSVTMCVIAFALPVCVHQGPGCVRVGAAGRGCEKVSG